MLGYLLAPLLNTLSPHFDLSKTRLETMAIILFGLANGRTVNLSHLASQFPGTALHASSYRRLQRFFEYVRLDGDVVARLIVGLLNLKGSTRLALDRTNWTLGKTDINTLVLAIVTRRFKVPLMWSFLNHPGNSSTPHRIGLIQRYLRVFGASSIKALLADREFIGDEWLSYLVESNVPFVIRLREDMHIETEDGRRFQFRSLLRKQRKGQWTGWLPGMARTPENTLRFEGRKIKGGELVLVVTNIPAPSNALRLYRKRWRIECLFADAKTRGFNIEDTHITNPDKLATLLVIVALAMTWAYRCASRAMGRQGILKKAHKRRVKSWFRIGFDMLRRWILYDTEKPFKLGDKPAQNDHCQTQTAAALCHESCTVPDAAPSGLFQCDGDATVAAYGAADQTWALREIDGQPVATSALPRFPEEGGITGNAPCNSYNSTLNAPCPWFEIADLTATRAACAGQEAEGVYFAALMAMT